MEELSNLPKEYLDPLLPCFLLLKNCNLLFFDDRPFHHRIIPYFYVLPCVVGYYVSLTMYLIEGFKRGMDLDELIFVVPVFVVCTQTIFKVMIVISKKKEIRFIILRMGRLWRNNDLSDVQISKKNELLKRLKFCYAAKSRHQHERYNTNLKDFSAFYWMNVIGSWQYILTPLLETIIRKYVLQQDCGLLLPFGCYFPFDPKNTWGVYIMAYTFEAYSMFRIVFYYLGTEFLMITLISHLGTEFTLLQEDLLQLKPSEHKDRHFDETDERADFNVNRVDEKARLGDLIRRHQILIALVQDLDSIFNKMIFVNLSSASISICFFGFAAKVAHDAISLLNNFVAVVALMLPIYNLCNYGELLKEASERVADAAYASMWYTGSKSYMKAIWFIIKRSQKHCSLTSLKYNPISLSTFTTVMSTTWSYFSLASSLYDESAEK